MGPDVIPIEVLLLGLRGGEVVKRLKELPEASGARIGALTGYDADHVKVRQVEFDFYPRKRVDLEILKAVLT
jgi:CheY-like chemotaxis protein